MHLAEFQIPPLVPTASQATDGRSSIDISVETYFFTFLEAFPVGYGVKMATSESDAFPIVHPQVLEYLGPYFLWKIWLLPAIQHFSRTTIDVK